MFHLRLKIFIVIFSSVFVTSQQTNNCTITEFSQVERVLRECTDIVISNLTVPGGVQLKLDLQKGSIVTFNGNIVFEVAYWDGHLIQVSGEGVLVQGAPGKSINVSLLTLIKLCK